MARSAPAAGRRKPGRGRDPERTRAAILQVAFSLIYERGFQGVGVRDIAARAGLTIGAFFHYFPTKNDVGFAVIDELIRGSVRERWIRPLAAYRNPVSGILRIYKKTSIEWSEEKLARGCPLNNLAQEMSAIDPVFREKTRGVLVMWIDELTAHLRRAQRDGYLAAGADARRVAEFIVAFHEGAFGMAKAMNDRRMFESLYDGLRQYLQALTPQGGETAE